MRLARPPKIEAAKPASKSGTSAPIAHWSRIAAKNVCPTARYIRLVSHGTTGGTNAVG